MTRLILPLLIPVYGKYSHIWTPQKQALPSATEWRKGLRTLRPDRGWSLDELSAICGISRATLSRLEKAEVTPTATVLGRLCAAFGLTMSRLIAMVESEFTSLITQHDQTVWADPETSYIRRSISPPAQTIVGEVLKYEIPSAQTIAYKKPPVRDWSTISFY